MRGASLRSRVADHLRDPLQRDAWFLIGNAVLGAGAGFLFWLVAARTVAPSEVGRGAAVVSAFTLAALLGKVGFDAVLVRHVPSLGAPSRRRLLTRALLVVAALTAALAFAVASVSGVPADALFVAFAVAVAAGWILDAWFVAVRRASASFARNVVFNGARIALIALPLLGAPSPGLAVAWGAAAALSLALAAFLPRRAQGDAPLPPFLATGASNFAVNVSEFLPTLAFPLVVAATLGAEANAAFYVAWTLAAVPFLGSKAIAQSTFAELSGGERATAVRRGARMHLLAIAPAAVAGLLAGPALLGLFGPHYVAGAPVLVVLLLALAPASVNNLAIAALKASDRPRALVAFSLALLAATLAGGVALLPVLGILGPAVAWLAANLLLLGASLPIVLGPPGWTPHARVRGRAREA